ncbi:hypothetical protein OUZ56_024131 [Daphnia magna]|uniref:Protein kinase domain-containing protein n=1 Tax=Daphnia magna TaxID=35525 RepID=A0ABR0B086_9CRUS|nr:hypothetical protein OUZ56_024131 [Daphnia magna]
MSKLGRENRCDRPTQQVDTIGIGTFGLVAQRTPGFPTLGLLALDTWTTGSRQEDICLATLGLLVPDVWARQSMLLNPASPLRDYDNLDLSARL